MAISTKRERERGQHDQRVVRTTNRPKRDKKQNKEQEGPGGGPARPPILVVFVLGVGSFLKKRGSRHLFNSQPCSFQIIIPRKTVSRVSVLEKQIQEWSMMSKWKCKSLRCVGHGRVSCVLKLRPRLSAPNCRRCCLMGS